MKKDPLTEDARPSGDNVGAGVQRPLASRTPIVVMGPAGSGKTTLGRRLAQALGRPYRDADDHHGPSNVAKMNAGLSLTDEERMPWLLELREILSRHPTTVLACSALRKSYRSLLRPETANVVFLLLDVPETELARRLQERIGHYAGPSLLSSQLSTLESPSGEPDSFVIDGTGPEEKVLERALAVLGLAPRPF